MSLSFLHLFLLVLFRIKILAQFNIVTCYPVGFYILQRLVGSSIVGYVSHMNWFSDLALLLEFHLMISSS